MILIRFKKGENMKLWTHFAFVFSVATSTSLTMALAESDLQFGDLQIAGHACDAESGIQPLQKVEGSEIRYKLPTSIYLRKDSSKSLLRGSCTFALPVTAAPGMKVIAANAEQLVSLRAEAKSNIKVELELFKSGSIGEKLVKELLTQEKSGASAEILRHVDLIAESECGGEIILRGNLSATLLGSGSSRAYARHLEMDILAVPCE